MKGRHKDLLMIPRSKPLHLHFLPGMQKLVPPAAQVSTK